jgi:hypothetical protein
MMKFLFALFLLSQVTLCKASFDKIREEAEAAIVGKAATAALKQDIDLVKDAIAKASPGSGGLWKPRWASSTNKNGDRQLKTSKKWEEVQLKKSKSSKNQNSQCEADLAVAQGQIEELSAPTLLGIQTTATCRVERAGKGSYKLISDTVSADTYIFSDRPSTIEYAVPTKDFIRDFDDIFDDSPPNTGLTFVQNGEPVGPFVVIFDEAKIVGNEVTYDIRQSESQSGVYSMEELFDYDDSVEFQDCSYFIDNWLTTYLTCPLCTAAVPALATFVKGIDCGAECAGVLGEACSGIGGLICTVACPYICEAILSGIGAAASSNAICSVGGLC